MKHFSEIPINKPYVVIIAGGLSVLDITVYQWALLRQKCYVITTNYAPVLLGGDLNAHSDRMVSEWLEGREFEQEILFKGEGGNYFWSDSDVKTKFTVTALLELLKKYHPEKMVLVFGVDGYHKPDERKDHWYDYFIEYRMKQNFPPIKNLYRGFDSIVKRTIEERLVSFDLVVNMNPVSEVTGYRLISGGVTDFLERLP